MLLALPACRRAAEARGVALATLHALARARAGPGHESFASVRAAEPEERDWIERDWIGSVELPRTHFTWILLAVAATSVTCCLSVCCFAHTCGRRYFFADAAIPAMKRDLDGRTPEGVKVHVASQQFSNMCDAFFQHHDRSRRGFVDFDGRLLRAIVAEYGREVEEHALFKEISLASRQKGRLDQGEFKEVLKYMEFIRHDRAQCTQQNP